MILVRSPPPAPAWCSTGSTTPARLRVAPGTHVVGLLNEERGIAREAAVEVAAGEETLDVALGQATSEP